jgi:hypothetical protein
MRLNEYFKAKGSISNIVFCRVPKGLTYIADGNVYVYEGNLHVRIKRTDGVGNPYPAPLKDFQIYLREKYIPTITNFYYSKKQHTLHVVTKKHDKDIRTSVKKSDNDSDDIQYAFLYAMNMHTLHITSSQLKKRIDDALVPFKIREKKRIISRPFQTNVSKEIVMLILTHMLVKHIGKEKFLTLYKQAVLAYDK